jgi:beta-lactamase regulating signal transducer with metallopeptidase domain
MTTEILVLVARLNLVGGVAILLVLALRPFARRWFGASQAYRLWSIVPVALVAALMPPTETWGPVGPVEHAAVGAGGWLGAGGHLDAVLAVWGAGALLATLLTAWRYARFMAQARSGRAGPAIVGVLTPKLVTPADFGHRYTPEERRLVRAHERAHMDREDARYNALVLALQCLNWFNPLIHIAARAMRFDQELACDATVIHRLPTDRRRYAEALLRSHAEAAPVLGCSWSGAGARLLMTRLTTLMGRRQAEARLELGDILMAVLWTAVVFAAWTAQPPYRLADPGSERAVYLSSEVPAVPVLVLPSVPRR